MNAWLKRWLFTTYHKDVGILYFVTSLYFGFIGAILAMLMRGQLAVPGNGLLTDLAYNQAVTMHGLIMILWFLSPLGIAFANYFVPLQIGAKDLAFPRLNALSYWMYLFGGLLAALGFFLPGGNANGGWTTYAPLADPAYSPGPGVTVAFLGLALLITSVTLGSVNFIVMILYMRAPGMTMRKMPIFSWFIFFTMIQMLFAFPTLLAGLIMLSADRLLGTLYFASTSGGAILWDNLFWFFGHPEVYIVLMPGFGAIGEILPALAGRALAGKNIIIAATAGAVVPLSFLVWQHHMFITGIPVINQQFYSVTTLLISLPFDVITISFIRTLAGGQIRMTTPLLFAVGAIILFIIGGITGVFLASPVLDVVFRGTFFVVAHFHYVMVGAAIFSLLGAIYYWLPKMTSHLYSERLGKLHFIISFIGFNLLYFPMFFLYEMPRRIATYSIDAGWSTLNLIASVGGVIFAVAQFLLIANLVIGVRGRIVSPPNPWRSLAPEWGGMPSIQALDAPGMPTNGNGSSEHHEQHLSSRPIALTIGVTLAMLGFSLLELGVGWPVIFVGLVVIAWSLYGWARDDLWSRFHVPEEEGRELWPFSKIPKIKLGMWTFLAGEVILFSGVLGSYLFIRADIPRWPSPGTIHSIPIGLTNTMVLLTSSLSVVLAIQAIRAGNQKRLLMWLTTTFLLGALFLGIKASEWADLFSKGFWFNSGLPGSTYFVTTGIHGLHVTAGLILLAYLIKRTMNGGFSKENNDTVEYFGLYWHFVDIIWVFLFPLFYLL
ncbi:MAG: cytochrome C oxidase subunit I [Thaumarchaeota archaeon]|nr:MAG: cytochrome C oxidase subunit I [Nitrososphaerota archaeon]